MNIVHKTGTVVARETEKRRAELRERLIDIAEAEVREHGMGSLRARALADQAGCAVGAIYNVFTDMTGLILAVNVRTFIRMGARVAGAVDGRENEPPLDRLVAMANAYVDFAFENLNLWRAVFGIEMTADSDVPDWYLQELRDLFAFIAAPLAELDPDATPEELELRTRTIFGAAHGVMLLSLERRMSGIPQEELKPMIEYLLRQAADPKRGT
ncbi:MAG: TetR/AcrR family transcriptional regulator [Paracoccaceae bacterium]|nr:TetR/AcrR family transcriptional regulator [Paracoccaceae bacterium]